MAGTIERLDRLSGGPCQLSAVPHRPLDMTIRPGRKDSSLHLILFWSIQKTGIADAIFYFLFDAVSRSRSPLILSHLLSIPTDLILAHTSPSTTVTLASGSSKLPNTDVSYHHTVPEQLPNELAVA